MHLRRCPRCGNALREGARFCGHCGASLSSTISTREGQSGKTSAPSSRTARKSSPYGRAVFITLATLTLIGGGVVFFKSLPFHPHPVIENQPVVAERILYADQRTDMVPISSRVEDGRIIFSLQDVLQHRMVGFEYSGGSVPMSLVAFISPEGKLVTSIAFCEPCNSKQYHAQNNTLICNACGTTWKMENLEGISGSCQKYPPDPIPSVVIEAEVQIDESKVKNWKTRI